MIQRYPPLEPLRNGADAQKQRYYDAVAIGIGSGRQERLTMGKREEAIVVDADAMAKAGGTEGYAKTSEDIARHVFNEWKAGISRQGPRDLLHRTDRLLWNLEVLNLAGCGQLRLPSGLRGEVVTLKERLSLGARTRLTRCRTVQDHVDAIFEVQKDLLSACVAQSLGDFGRKLLQASDDDD